MKDVQTEMLLSVMEEPVVDADGVVYLFNTSMDLLNPFDQNWLWGKRGFSGEWRLHEVVDTGVLILSVYPTLGQES